jgi:3-phenylpropionate/trans-cinnamate dioxygenase ferredoxin component
MRYVFTAKASELADGGKLKAKVEGRDILLTRFGETVYAIDNKCPHMGGSLYDGAYEDGLAICPRHGSGFDVKTGKAVRGGKMGPIRFTPGDARSYPIQLQGEDILVGIE